MTAQLLTDADLVALTKRTKHTAQKKCLIRAGFPFRERDDGSIIITWATINHCLIGDKSTDGPDLSALDRLG